MKQKKGIGCLAAYSTTTAIVYLLIRFQMYTILHYLLIMHDLLGVHNRKTITGRRVEF
jgi:hypothetical protein